MTGNKIGDGGAKSVSEMLKTNTTLTSLHLDCEKGKKRERGKKVMAGRQVMRLEIKEQKH